MIEDPKAIRVEKETLIAEAITRIDILENNTQNLVQLMTIQSNTIAELLEAGKLMRDILKEFKERLDGLEQGKNGREASI